MKVMIVDDSRGMRMIVARTLRQAGFNPEVVEASSGMEAFTLLQTSIPDLMLCDWNMPGMTGLELLLKIREAGIGVKAGLVTSESTAEMRSRAKDAGALFVIAKPFTPETFEEQLRPVLGS